MELRPWMISVLSTSYDLKDYRKAVVDELKSKNIAVSAGEPKAQVPDYPHRNDDWRNRPPGDAYDPDD